MIGKSERIVVAGAGVAGLRAAERLRELGFTGELVVVGAEPDRPYHRPSVSKQLITDDWQPRDAALPAYRALGAHWWLGTHVTGLDVGGHRIHLPGGETLHYDGLVIATGLTARHLSGAPRNHPRLHRLRTLADAMALRAALAEDPGPVVVIGTGFTGCELACALRALRRPVTILGRSATLLGKGFGPQVGARLTRLHRANGVRLVLGAGIAHWGTKSDAIVIHLSDGHLLLASHVVVCVGSVPSTGWLRGSGLPVGDGVLCEPTCHVAGAPDIVAAGDVARWPNLRFGPEPRRVEHWLNAVEMGRAAAESLLAGRSAAAPFTPLPRFWTEQHGIRVQGAGLPELGEASPRRPASDSAITRYVRAGRVVGVVAVEAPGAMVELTRRLDADLRPPNRTPQWTVGGDRWHTIASGYTSGSVAPRS